MERVDDVYSICLPDDVISEILSELPAKSLVTCSVVSRGWYAIIRNKSFINRYMNRASPRLLLMFNQNDAPVFESINPEAPSSSYGAKSSYDLSLNKPGFSSSYNISPPVRGLICYEDLDKVVVANPSTGQFLVLPELNFKRSTISAFMCYDAVTDVYKVLCTMNIKTLCTSDSENVETEGHRVVSLGKKQKKDWRTIEYNLPHAPATEGLCLNGHLYHGACVSTPTHNSVIVTFNVRLEQFSRINLPEGVEILLDCNSGLVNYFGGQLDFWVLQAVANEWSKISVVTPLFFDIFGQPFDCRGATTSGKFILTPSDWTSPPFYMIIYNIDEETFTKVVIEGDNLDRLTVFLDHYEYPIFF